MSIHRKLLYAAAVLVIIICAVLVSSRPVQKPDVNSSGRLQVMATTTLLECAVREIAGDRVKVGVLIAPGSCPGHYDIRPEDMKTLSASAILFTHGYEGFVPQMMKSIGSDSLKQVAIDVKGNWMIPAVYIKALKQVSLELSKSDPEHSDEYNKTLARLTAEYTEFDAEIKARLEKAGAKGVRVLCSDQQMETAEWLGLDVVDVYPRAEQFTPVLLHYMTDVGRRNKVRMCVDNLQSGPDAGKPLAQDIGASHAVLSNFPGGFKDTDTWKLCVEDNVNRVIEGLKAK